MTFEEAITASEAYATRNLLLGNGFSIACRPDIFTYHSLFEQTDFTATPELAALFASLDSRDFELVIRTLNNAERVLEVYEPTGQTLISVREHQLALRELLIRTISENHPANPGDITEDEYRSCRQFLTHFLGYGTQGKVFSVNYDLLLYWTVLHTLEDAPALPCRKTDGFGLTDGNLFWTGTQSARPACIYYPHGALHMFDTGTSITKLSPRRDGGPIVDQCRQHLEDGHFPMFVAEGTSLQKQTKISHNPFLFHAKEQLQQAGQEADSCFFVYGHSLDANDDHLLKAISKGNCGAIFISLYGDENSDVNTAIRERAHGWAAIRDAAFPLNVHFFDAESAHVWNAP